MQKELNTKPDIETKGNRAATGHPEKCHPELVSGSAFVSGSIPFPFTVEQMNNMPAGSYIIKNGELIPEPKKAKVKAEPKDKDEEK